MGDLERLLTPAPRAFDAGGAPLRLGAEMEIDADETLLSGRLGAAVDRTLNGLGRARAAGPAAAERTPLRLALDSRSAQSYRLVVDASGIEVIGGDEAGLFYGLQTLAQWVGLHPDGLVGGVTIDDRPDFLHRGVMLDVSRGRVPAMPHLTGLIDRLAEWKVNQLQLYTEHTFAYRGHEEAWRGWSPFTASEVRKLDAFCRDRYIELVPNQNTFGHMHRWLVHDRYRDLAECPEGIDHPFSQDREPFSLCPLDPRCLELVEDLMDQLLPNFSSGLFNVGLDETFDLGMGRSQAECARRGKEEVYLDYLLQIHRRVADRGHRMLFWGDILIERPDLVALLPSEIQPLLWGYHADHPFEKECEIVASQGLEYYVCPGTSTWNSLGGRLDNALQNLSAAARAAHGHGASGYLITDWGDNGHLQPPIFSEPAFLAGARFAWRADSALPSPEELAAQLDRWAFGGQKIGAIVTRIGDLYRAAGKQLRNSSALFHLLVFAHEPLAKRHVDNLKIADLEEVVERAQAIAREISLLPEASPRHQLQKESLRWANDALHLGAHIGIERLLRRCDESAADLPAQTRQALASQVEGLVLRHRALWPQTSRPGGLDYSAAYLERVAAALSAGRPA